MATEQQWKNWGKAMVQWAKDVVKWQREHEDRDWLAEVCHETQTETHGGDHPPLPPPKP